MEHYFDYAFPFEGNWNDFAGNISFVFHALITLSRLKGIETLLAQPNLSLLQNLWLRFPVWRELKLCVIAGVLRVKIFDYAFPFEGNWNVGTPVGLVGAASSWLWLRFPVWRELKPCIINSFREVCQVPLITLSRLKGIETKITAMSSWLVCTELWLRFPVWRELKPNCEPRFIQVRSGSLITLSRLKGIETFIRHN